MRYTSRREIEYLSSIDGGAARDQQFVDEMQQRLDALRHFDQSISPNDWRPRAADARWRPDSPLRVV